MIETFFERWRSGLLNELTHAFVGVVYTRSTYSRSLSLGMDLRGTGLAVSLFLFEPRPACVGDDRATGFGLGFRVLVGAANWGVGAIWRPR